jgi:hypothetical protein
MSAVEQAAAPRHVHSLPEIPELKTPYLAQLQSVFGMQLASCAIVLGSAVLRWWVLAAAAALVMFLSAVVLVIVSFFAFKGWRLMQELEEGHYFAHWTCDPAYWRGLRAEERKRRKWAIILPAIVCVFLALPLVGVVSEAHRRGSPIPVGLLLQAGGGLLLFGWSLAQLALTFTFSKFHSDTNVCLSRHGVYLGGVFLPWVSMGWAFQGAVLQPGAPLQLKLSFQMAVRGGRTFQDYTIPVAPEAEHAVRAWVRQTHGF